MKIFHFLILLSFSISAHAEASICSQVYHQSESSAESFGPWQRARVVCDLKNSLKEKYSLQEWKKDRLGIALEDHMEDCIHREIFSDITERLYRDLDLPQFEFEDRVLQCLAPFQDTHLAMTSQTERPRIYAGISLVKVGNSYVVESVNKTIRDFWLKDPELAFVAKALVPGVEISTIDGKSPGELVARYSKYISGSSPAYVERAAVRSIFLRGFDYPTIPNVEIKLAGNNMVFQLPWFSMGINQRADARLFFQKIRIPSANSLLLDFDLKVREGLNQTGFDEKTPLIADDKVVNFFDDDSKLSLRFNEVKLNQKDYCYIQLLTFATKRWRLGSAGGKIFSFMQPLELQLSGCEAAHKPVILDLRSNNGGDSDFPALLMAALTEKGKKYGATATSGLLTHHLEEVLGKYSLGDGFPVPDLTTAPGRFFIALNHALKAGMKYLPFVVAPNINPSLKEGFNQPLVVLTGPYCISACDLMVDLIRKTGRGKILGEATNGTGGGFLEIGKTPSASFTDDIFGSITVKIPNVFRVVLPSPVQEGNWYVDFDEGKNWIGENGPVLVQIPYSTKPIDLIQPGSGWMAEAVKALE